MSLAKRDRAEGLMLACKHILYLIFFFLLFMNLRFNGQNILQNNLLFWVLDGRRFLHKRKGGITHDAHMFALRDCWNRHDLMVVFVLL